MTGKLGLCIICGERVTRAENYLKAAEGYCHQMCLSQTLMAA